MKEGFVHFIKSRFIFPPGAVTEGEIVVPYDHMTEEGMTLAEMASGAIRNGGFVPAVMCGTPFCSPNLAPSAAEVLEFKKGLDEDKLYEVERVLSLMGLCLDSVNVHEFARVKEKCGKKDFVAFPAEDSEVFASFDVRYKNQVLYDYSNLLAQRSR